MSAYLGLHPTGAHSPPSPRQPPQTTPLSSSAPSSNPNPANPAPSSSALRPHRLRRPASTLPNPLIIPDSAPCPRNETMFQAFEWYIPRHTDSTPSHWKRLRGILPALRELGVTSMWIPPACKAARPEGNGYDIYDLYDLGEFEQKGTRETKWGAKEELGQLTEEAEKMGVRVLFDAVLNHKAGADFKEEVVAMRVDERDRRKEVTGKKETIEAWTGWRFEGRRGVHGGLEEWNWKCFTGIDWDGKRGEKGVWRFEGKEWAGDVDEELGNYDYLMFADLDHNQPAVKEDIFRWATWLQGQLRLGGMRLDAIKHYSYEFLRSFVDFIHREVDPDWFVVGEYWREDSEFLARYIEFMRHRISLFDVQLVSNFSRISLQGAKGDLRTLFDDALVVWKPNNAVTFVVNHDTQEGQSLETPVAPFFIPSAYSLILLRANTGLPCVFYSDLYGSFGQHPSPAYSNFIPPTSGGQVLPKLLLARQLWAYGSQYDYFDHPKCVGFTRLGHPSHSGGAGLAVIITNSWRYAKKRMFVGKRHAGEVWTDLLRWCPGQVVIDEEGWGEFMVAYRGVAVWVNSEAEGREMVDRFVFDTDVYGFEKAAARERPQSPSWKMQSEQASAGDVVMRYFENRP